MVTVASDVRQDFCQTRNSVRHLAGLAGLAVLLLLLIAVCLEQHRAIAGYSSVHQNYTS